MDVMGIGARHEADRKAEQSKHEQQQREFERESESLRDHYRKTIATGADLSALYGRATLTGSNEETARAFDQHHRSGCNGVPLGRGLGWNFHMMQGHGITFGSSRLGGKGVQSVIPALLSYTGSMVVIDPKGENAWVTAERRRQMGHRVVILDPWNEVNRRYGSKASPPVVEPTTRFNPLSHIDPDSEDFADDVGAIADAMVIPGLGEPHWTDSARELIGGLIASRVMQKPGKAHLGEVRDAITADDAQLEKLVKEIVERFPDSLAARKLRRFSKCSDNKEFTSIRSTAETQSAVLDSRRLIEAMMTGDPPFSLDELGTSPVTLYLVLPVDRLLTHGRWLRLILTMAIRTIARQAEPPPLPVVFLLDEMGTIGGLTMVQQAYGLMAGVGIRIWAILQDLNQLKSEYPKSWETFISNSSVIQALKVTDVTTSEYLSQLLGTITLERISGESMEFRKTNPNFKGMGDQVHARPLLLPQEIRNLPSTKVLNICPGINNFLMDRQPYYAPDSPWAGLYRSPPRFTRAAGQSAPVASPPPQPVTPPQSPARDPATASADPFAWKPQSTGTKLNFTTHSIGGTSK